MGDGKAGIRIDPLRGDHHMEWDDYVRRHPSGSLYLLTPWKRAVEKAFGLTGQYFVARDDNGIRGVLPIFIVRTLFSGKVAVSLPHGGNYAGVLADTPETENALLAHAQAFTAREGCGHLELRCLHERPYSLPKQTLYVTYVKELENSEEAILAAIPRKSRASVRNGYSKFGLTGSVGRDYRTLYELYAMNKRTLGSPVYPRSYLRSLLEEYGENAGTLTVSYQGRAVAALIFFRYADTMIPTFSGADNRYNFTNANNVMYYELMKLALGQGCRYFDFGRSRKGTGSGRFKENMGFEARQLHFYFSMHRGGDIPNVSPSNKKFGSAIGLWSRLPLPVTKILGPAVVRYFP